MSSGLHKIIRTRLTSAPEAATIHYMKEPTAADIRAELARRELTQDWLADKIGVHPSRLSRVLHGDRLAAYVLRKAWRALEANHG